MGIILERERGDRKGSSLDWFLQTQEDAGSGSKSGNKSTRATALSGLLVSNQVLPFKLKGVICIFISNLITAELINGSVVTKEIYFCKKLMLNV